MKNVSFSFPILSKIFVPVPHQYAYVVEFLGRYQKTLQPGLNLLFPYLQKVAYRHSLKEQTFVINAQHAVTKDNVFLFIDGILYLKINDPVKCSYGAEAPLNYTYTLAQSIMRSEIGKLTLDQTFEERDSLNIKILESLQSATEDWGIACTRYEIKDIKMTERIKEIMKLQAESERIKRADIINSLEINLSEAIKRSNLLRAEAKAQEILLRGKAISYRIEALRNALSEEKGELSMQYKLAEKYIAENNKSMIIKANVNQPREIIDKSLEFLQIKEGNNSEKNVKK